MYRDHQGLHVLISADGPDDTIRLRAAGELDLASLDVLRQALDGALKAGLGDVEVDSSELTFCDCAGLCLLLSTQRKLNAAGRRLRLLDPAPAVLRLLDLTSTRQMFEVRTSPSRPGERRRSNLSVTDLVGSVPADTAWGNLDPATEQLYDELCARIAAIVDAVPCLGAPPRLVPMDAELVRAAGRVVSSLRSNQDPDAARHLIGNLWPTYTPPHAGHAWWYTPLGTILTERGGSTSNDDTVLAP